MVVHVWREGGSEEGRKKKKEGWKCSKMSIDVTRMLIDEELERFGNWEGVVTYYGVEKTREGKGGEREKRRRRNLNYCNRGLQTLSSTQLLAGCQTLWIRLEKVPCQWDDSLDELVVPWLSTKVRTLSCYGYYIWDVESRNQQTEMYGAVAG